MNSIVKVIVFVGVALAVAVGLRAVMKSSPRAPTPAEAQQQMAELRARAEREHPEMAKTDALKAASTDQARTMLAGADDADERARMAAEMFYGFYFVNTRGRPQYCRQRGVDLAPFVAAFERVHKKEFDRASAIYAKAGTDPESLMPVLQPLFGPALEQDMKDVATGAQVPVEDVCALFNEHAEQFAPAIALPPETVAALGAG